MWHTMTLEEVKRKLRCNLEYGLTKEEVERRTKEGGKNKLVEGKKESLFIKFIKQFNDFMIITLLVAAIISAGISYFEGSNDYIDSIIIVAIVVFNALMGVMQEAKAEKSIESLKQMSAPIAKVKREGKIINIPSEDVVCGDILILEAGNYVPADCRLINSYNLKIEESSLTGETVPVTKDSDRILPKDVTLGDMANMAFATTIVTNGHAEAIATEIGMNTKVGHIANMILTDESPETPLQRKLGEVGKKLGLVALSICSIIFVIGIIKKIPPVEMFMTSIGLAVAAIPEGLPAVVTIMLSIGVTKMARKNAIIRKLPAVETLGSSSVICSDKTGTLTQNKMQVIELADINGRKNIQIANNEFIIELGTMCNDSTAHFENGKWEVQGDPTETAIVNAGIELGERKENLYVQMPRINEIPFDSNRKMMTTIHKIGNKYRIITKGAPDILLKRCNRYKNGENIEILNQLVEDKILGINTQMAEKALRVLGVAYSDIDYLPNTIDSGTIEKNLVFAGLIGMIDPPREGVKEAVETCRHAGIRTVMITGDHIITAKAIAKELGILKQGDKSITGVELDKIPQENLEKDIMNYSVFARVSPEHKVRIVKAFRSKRKSSRNDWRWSKRCTCTKKCRYRCSYGSKWH